MKKERVVVAMSGGVDSSVAAAILKERGYDVVGVTMRLWTSDQEETSVYSRSCCSLETVEDARRVCQILDIPYYVMNFEREFETYVIDYFVEEYRRGRTPNPCLACNQYLKFKFLLQKAFGLGATYLSTGHYARIDFENGEYHLRKAVDSSKDQSYVLFTLGQDDLSHLLLPLGEMAKSQVRALAERIGLPVAQKADSQEICFVTGKDYKQFIEERAGPSRPGKIVDVEGKTLGSHQGIIGFTVGQRRGLGIAAREPLFVIRVDPENDLVVVGPQEQLLKDLLTAEQVTFVAGRQPQGTLEVKAKIRYRTPEVPARITPVGDKIRVEFEQPQRGITPGQAVVFYKEDEVLGGGIIE